MSAPKPNPDIILIPLSASLFGFISGLLTSSKLSSKQYLAENAHRLPTTVQGWYFYQKTKNYKVMFGGIKGGLRTGGKMGGWTLGFVGILEGLEKGINLGPLRGEGRSTRWASGAVAGTALGGVAALLCESFELF